MSNDQTNKPVILTDPVAIRLFSLTTLIRAMDLEIRTGMKMSRGQSTLQIAKRNYNIKSKTKIKAVDELRELYDQLTREYFEITKEDK